LMNEPIGQGLQGCRPVEEKNPLWQGTEGE
jgi:hypothetical protein